MRIGLGALRQAVSQAADTIADRLQARAWFLPIALVYLCLLSFASAVLFGFGGTEKYAGWTWRTHGGQTEVVSVDQAGPASVSLRSGDRLVAVNGDARAGARGPRPWLEEVDPGKSYTLQISRAGAQETAVLTMDSRPSPTDMVAGLADLLLSAVFAAVSLFVWWAKPEDELVRWCSGAGLLMAFFLTGAAIGPVSHLLSGAALVTYFLLKSIFPFHLVAGAEFFARFPTGAKPIGFWRSWLNALWFGGIAVWLLTLPQRLLPLLGLEYRLDILSDLDLTTRPELGQVVLRHGFAGVCGAYLFAVSIRNYRSLSDAAMRLRVKWVLFGSTLGVVPSLLASATLAVLDASSLVPQRMVREGVGLYSLATLSLGWIPVAVGYAVVCHRLMKIRVAITGGLQLLMARRVLQATTLLLSLAAAAYLLLVWRHPGNASPFAILLACLLLGLGVLRKEVLDAVDRLLMRLPYGREQATRGLMERLRSEPTRAGVAARAVAVIEPLIRPASIYVYASEGGETGRFRRLYAFPFGEAPPELAADAAVVRAATCRGTLFVSDDLRQTFPVGEGLWLERDNIEVAVPIAQGEEQPLMGLMLMAAKVSGDGYTATDLDILQDVSRCVAMALQVLDLEEARRLSEARRLEAEEADRRKLQFLAHMSHELRTPLHGMLGVTDLLLGTELTVQQEEYARLILRSSESMVAIANDILDLSKLEAGKVQLQKVHINWLELIEDCLAIASERARSETVEFLLVAPSAMPRMLLGDPHRVRQILTNLLDNAAKYTERGWVIVRVGTVDDEWEVQVEDTGPGIRQDLQVRLFSDYEQDSVHPPGERPSGAGLGLAISKRLAEAMGGRLTFTTRLGSGTTFMLRLPLMEPPEAKVASLPLSGTEVALIDERPQSTEAYALALRRLGALVRTVRAPLSSQNLTGCEAAILVHREDSGSLHSRLRLLRAATPAPLVVLYGGRPPLTATAARAHGVLTQLRRPVRQESLCRAIQDAVHMSAATSVSTAAAAAANNLPVLVVEDDPASARMMELLLRQIGCTATVATNGQSALELMEAVSFSLVFLDFDLPGLNGAEILQQLRARPEQAARVPVVVLSGHAEPEKQALCLSAGADAYLVKPLGLAQLQQTVLQYSRRAAEA